MALKTALRYSLIIITLGLFSSCSERFSSRGETPNRFYSSNYPTEHSTTITQSRKLFTRTLKRDTVRYAHKKLTASTAIEKTALTERAHTNALKSSNSISPDILLGDSFGGSPITAEKSLTKVVKRLQSPHFSPNKRSGINKSHTFFKKEKGNLRKTVSRNNLISILFPEAPGSYSSIWEWIVYINFILVLVASVIGGIYVISMLWANYELSTALLGILGVLLAICLAVFVPYNQITEFENLENHSGFYQFAYWLFAVSLIVLIALMPIALTMEDPYFILLPIITGGAGLFLYLIAMFTDFLFGEENTHWIFRLLLGILIIIIILLLIYSIVLTH